MSDLGDVLGFRKGKTFVSLRFVLVGDDGTAQLQGIDVITAVGKVAAANIKYAVAAGMSCGVPARVYADFSQTETCVVLSLVNGSRCQPLQRSRKAIPASRAIRSSSDGQT